MSEENKALDRRWWEKVWNQGSLSSYQELASPDVVMHNTPEGITGDFEGIRQANLNLRTGFPDHDFEIDAQVAEGDQLVSLWT
jgi:predicted ester cyclase